jgi:hypothetical protein
MGLKKWFPIYTKPFGFWKVHWKFWPQEGMKYTPQKNLWFVKNIDWMFVLITIRWFFLLKRSLDLALDTLILFGGFSKCRFEPNFSNFSITWFEFLHIHSNSYDHMKSYFNLYCFIFNVYWWMLGKKNTIC